MAGVTRGNVYNLLAAQFYRLTETGLPAGQLDTTVALVNASTSHAYKIAGTTEATLPDPTYGRVTFRDGATFQGAVVTGLSDTGDITITTNAWDATLNKLFSGVNVDTTTITNATISSTGMNIISPYVIGCLLTAQIYSRDAATLGTTKHTTWVIGACSARVSIPSLTQNDGENPSTATITLTPRAATKLPVGAAFGANQNFGDNKEFVYAITADNPFALTMFVQDAIATTYTTAYLPTSSDVASGNTTNLFAVNGTPTAPTSIVTTTGVVTLAAAGTAGQIAAALYQTLFDTV